MLDKTMGKRLACALVGVCMAALFALAGCGSDALQTTREAGGESQSASSAATGQMAEGVREAASDEAPAADEVLVSIDTSRAHAQNDKFPETMGTFMVKVGEGMSVLDALEACGVDVGMRGKDYVMSINGLEEKVCGRDSGWLYLVDGVQPTKTSNDYQLAGGETVVWAYTVEQGDVGQKME